MLFWLWNWWMWFGDNDNDVIVVEDWFNVDDYKKYYINV